MARTLSSPKGCWVIPMDQTRTPVRAAPRSRANSSISSRGTPLERSSISQGWSARARAISSKPVVRAATNSRSTSPSAIIPLIAPFRKAASPPTRTRKNRSAICVPKRALSATEGIQ